MKSRLLGADGKTYVALVPTDTADEGTYIEHPPSEPLAPLRIVR